MTQKDRIYLYDSTLRDGAQTSTVNFSARDKKEIALSKLKATYRAQGLVWPEEKKKIKKQKQLARQAKRAKQKIEKDTGIMFPIKTKTAIDDFIKSRAGKPNLVQYEVVDGTLIFPNSKNNSKGRTESIVSTVMKNAGVRYTIKQKESFSEAQIKAIIKEEILKALKK